MNDITALALLVSKAKASVFTMEYISQFEAADIDSDDVDLRFEVDGVETGTNVSIVDECGQAAQMITALVEALEKAQTDGSEYAVSERAVVVKNVELQDEIYGLKARIAELESQRKLAFSASNRWADKFREAEKRIADLESRTVTVKLPLPRRKTADDYVDDTFEPSDLAAIYNACRLECEVKFKNALAAAGINVEAE